MRKLKSKFSVAFLCLILQSFTLLASEEGGITPLKELESDIVQVEKLFPASYSITNKDLFTLSYPSMSSDTPRGLREQAARSLFALRKFEEGVKEYTRHLILENDDPQPDFFYSLSRKYLSYELHKKFKAEEVNLILSVYSQRGLSLLENSDFETKEEELLLNHQTSIFEKQKTKVFLGLPFYELMNEKFGDTNFIETIKKFSDELQNIHSKLYFHEQVPAQDLYSLALSLTKSRKDAIILLGLTMSAGSSIADYLKHIAWHDYKFAREFSKIPFYINSISTLLQLKNRNSTETFAYPKQVRSKNRRGFHFWESALLGMQLRNVGFDDYQVENAILIILKEEEQLEHYANLHLRLSSSEKKVTVQDMLLAAHASHFSNEEYKKDQINKKSCLELIMKFF